MDSLSPPRRQDYGVERGASSVSGCPAGERRRQSTKVLFKVNIQSGLQGPVQVMMSPESTTAELMQAALAVYVKEKRRPLLATADPGSYELHYSQFSLQSLRPEEKLMDLGSRNFFVCAKPTG